MELVKALGKRVVDAPVSEQAALHLQIATLYHGRFSNLVEAIKSYERVLALEPDHRKALDALRAIYEKRRDWEKLLELEKGELGRTAPEKRADKAIDVARLAAARVSKPDIQLYWWERVIEHEPDHRQAFGELTKLYAHAERFRDLAAILKKQADAAAGNDDRAAALKKLACVQDACLGDRTAAASTLQQIIELDPGDAETKRTLADLRANKTFEWPADFRVVGAASTSVASTTPIVVAEPAASARPRILWFAVAIVLVATSLIYLVS